MFCLNSNLQVGDIILVRGGKLHSMAIAHASGGHFSHACLCVRDRTVVESITSTGVQYSSVGRFAFMERENVAILRPNFQDDIQKKLCQENIADVAADNLGKGYDFSGASTCLFDKQMKVSEDKFFCSQLVAAIFDKVGFPLFDKPSEKVNPNEFPNSNKLYDVTEITISEIPKYVLERYQRRGEHINFLDDKGSSESESHRILFNYFKEVAPIFKKYGIAPPKNIPDTIYVLTDPWNRTACVEIDRKITKKFDKMQVIKKISELATKGEEDDIKYLKGEIEKYGANFIKIEISNCLAFIMQANDSKKDVEISVATCREAYGKLKFRFLRRAIQYYEFILRNLDYVISQEQSILSALYQYSKTATQEQGVSP